MSIFIIYEINEALRKGTRFLYRAKKISQVFLINFPSQCLQRWLVSYPWPWDDKGKVIPLCYYHRPSYPQVCGIARLSIYLKFTTSHQKQGLNRGEHNKYLLLLLMMAIWRDTKFSILKLHCSTKLPNPLSEMIFWEKAQT